MFNNANSRLGRSASFETLERRDLMAGNVIARVIDGDLVIRGDDASNGVKVTRLDATTYQVSGFTVGGADTRINTVPNGIIKLVGVTRDINANFFSGNDELSLHGASPAAPLTAPRDINIDMDAGNDQVYLKNVKAGGKVDVSMGSGVDQFIADNVVTGGNLIVRESTTPYYAGNSDFVNIYGYSNIGGQLNVKFNRGNDSFKTNNTTAKSVWLEGGCGNDAAFIDNTKIPAFNPID